MKENLLEEIHSQLVKVGGKATLICKPHEDVGRSWAEEDGGWEASRRPCGLRVLLGHTHVT